MEVNLNLVLGFEWDDGNTRKNEKHGVAQAEIEQIFFRQPLIITSDLKHSLMEPRYHGLGRTDENRLLQVTFTLRERGTLIRPISARPMNRKERSIYEKALKAHS